MPDAEVISSFVIPRFLMTLRFRIRKVFIKLLVKWLKKIVKIHDVNINYEIF